jgi:hypothetical protein
LLKFSAGGFWLLTLLSTTAYAAPGGIPDCALNADVKAYLRGREDVDDEMPVVEASATSEVIQFTTAGRCGRGTELIDTIKASRIRVRLRTGLSIDFYPLLLTDKREGEWSCNRIKLRSACVILHRRK